MENESLLTSKARERLHTGTLSPQGLLSQVLREVWADPTMGTLRKDLSKTGKDLLGEGYSKVAADIGLSDRYAKIAAASGVGAAYKERWARKMLS